MGPLELGDLDRALDVVLAIGSTFKMKRATLKYPAASAAKKMVRAGQLGRKAAAVLQLRINGRMAL